MTTETSNARGEVVAWFPTNAQGEMALHWIDRYAAGIDDECQIDLVADALGVTLPDGYATAPPAAARGDVWGLVGRWLAEADRAEANADRAERRGHSGEADAMRQAAQDARGYAAELEAALSQQPDARGVVDEAVAGLSEQISALQSTRDRLKTALVPMFGDAFDGDFDVMLDAINCMKRMRTLTALTEARNVR
jgi:hypothetical protein